MFHTRFFGKLYLSYALIVLATALVIGALIHHRMEQSLNRDVRDRLKSAANLAAIYAQEVLERIPRQAIQSQLKQLAKSENIRTTFILPNGTVIADSAQKPGVLLNQKHRHEFLQALKAPFGISQRFSPALNTSMLHVSRAVRKGEKVIGVVRVSLPLSEIKSQLATMRLTIFYGALIGSAVALLVGIVVGRRITVPIRRIIEVAEAMRSGSYHARVRNLPKNEIGLLGDTFNRLGREVTKRITSISNERAQFRAMLSSMVEGVIAVDETDTILFSNQAAKTLLSDAEIDKPGRKLWECTQLLNIRELVDKAKNSEGSKKRELVLHGFHGSLVLDVEATKFVGGDKKGVIVVFHDITELRRLERIRRDFVANVSHELKTPLTTIKGYVETLANGALYDEQNNQRFLTKINTQVDLLANLVQDLLHLARIESPDNALPLTSVNLTEIVKEVLQHHEISIRSKSLNIEIFWDEEKPFYVMGDRKALSQIASNLVDNAIKYTPDEGNITLRLRPQENFVHLEVEDSGVGIPEYEQSRIFERFYRVDKARTQDQGTGLGLAIVKHLVQAMHGEVRVQSATKGGSRFTVEIPAAPNV